MKIKILGPVIPLEFWDWLDEQQKMNPLITADELATNREYGDYFNKFYTIINNFTKFSNEIESDLFKALINIGK